MTFTAQHGYDGRNLTIYVPSGNDGAITVLSNLCAAKHNGYMTITVETPKKKRSTGWKSQNHHLFGHAAQIGKELGYDRREMVYLIAEMTPEWPMAEYKGKMVPVSESRITSDVAAAAIETAHRIAADNGIVLIESSQEAIHDG